MSDVILIQQPAVSSGALILLFHGVGAQPGDLVPLGQALAKRQPAAWVVSVRSPDPADLGRGWQWFSVVGVTEDNRPARVAEAMPRFADTVRHWQRRSGVGAARTTLIGFSQGAIMALESTQQAPGLAGAVVSIAGRFTQPPRTAPEGTRIHLMHGDADAVMPVRLARDAADTLTRCQAEVTLDVFPGLGHGVDARVLAAIDQRLALPHH
ncbi:MAG: esterase [Hydrogenophaga sp.]|uniref:esterase n=1 Tax=unclassified Hydrogenophaga TaxID=2610897 RepID=UPI0036D30A52